MMEAARPKIMLVMVSGDKTVDEEGGAEAGAELGDMFIMPAERTIGL